MQWKAEVASLQKDLKQAEKKCVTWGGVTVFSPENCLSGVHNEIKKPSEALPSQVFQVVAGASTFCFHTRLQRAH